MGKVWKQQMYPQYTTYYYPQYLQAKSQIEVWMEFILSTPHFIITFALIYTEMTAYWNFLADMKPKQLKEMPLKGIIR